MQLERFFRTEIQEKVHKLIHRKEDLLWLLAIAWILLMTKFYGYSIIELMLYDSLCIQTSITLLKSCKKRIHTD